MTDLLRLESTLVGVSGEYFVAAELSFRGYLASVTLRNSRGIDIIASSADASGSVSIQVKTSRGKTPKWILSKKSEDFFSDSHFYVFVLLKSLGTRPDFFVAPSIAVAKYIYILRWTMTKVQGGWHAGCQWIPRHRHRDVLE